MKNKFILGVNKIIVFYVFVLYSLVFSASQSSMDVEPSIFSASSSHRNTQENFIKIIEFGLANSITLKNPTHLITYYAAQYGGKPTSIIEVFSTLALNFPSMPPERVKSIMMKLTTYIVMSTDSLASNYDTNSEEGIGLKILDRMTALVRKQKIFAISGRIYFENGMVFDYETQLKAAAAKRKGIVGKNTEAPVCMENIEY